MLTGISFMSACDPLEQAERRFKACCLNRSRWDCSLAAGRGALSHLYLVSATCKGTVKPWFAKTSRIRGRHPVLKSCAVLADLERITGNSDITR